MQSAAYYAKDEFGKVVANGSRLHGVCDTAKSYAKRNNQFVKVWRIHPEGARLVTKINPNKDR